MNADSWQVLNLLSCLSLAGNFSKWSTQFTGSLGEFLSPRLRSFSICFHNSTAFPGRLSPRNCLLLSIPSSLTRTSVASWPPASPKRIAVGNWKCWRGECINWMNGQLKLLVPVHTKITCIIHKYKVLFKLNACMCKYLFRGPGIMHHGDTVLISVASFPGLHTQL